jgi:pyroglutamyl-peptidase
MTQTILLTSFHTWKASQPSNASDDLLHHVLQDSAYTRPHAIHTLRQIPVDFQHAPVQVIAQIQEVQPDLILLCGMAASRKLLNLEHQAIAGRHVRTTSLDLREIRKGLSYTRVSKNAGRFVCNGLYYSVLSYLQMHQLEIPCLFVHVPVLTSDNITPILKDFQALLDRILISIQKTEACLSLPCRATITL